MLEFNKFLATVVRPEIPSVKIKYKDESFFMKFLNIFVCLFNKTFMNGYITTIGNTVYFPSKKYVEDNEIQAVRILAHEFVHLTDRVRINGKYFNGVYELCYLFPQCLALLSLFSFLAFINIYFLFCLCFLVCLVPFPAPGREYLESRGYAMTMFMNFLDRKQDYSSNYNAEVIAELFTGHAYYYMSRNKVRVTETLVYLFTTLPQNDLIFRKVFWFVENNP